MSLCHVQIRTPNPDGAVSNQAVMRLARLQKSSFHLWPAYTPSVYHPSAPSYSLKLSPSKLAKIVSKDSASHSMGKSDIESWLASTSTSSPAEDSENPNGNGLSGWRRDLIVNDWQAALSAARRLLLTSSTKIRTRFLHEELLYIARNCGMHQSSYNL